MNQQVNLKLGLPAAHFDIDDATLIGNVTTAQQLFFSIDGIPLELTLAYEILDPYWQPSLQLQADNQDSFGGDIELF